MAKTKNKVGTTIESKSFAALQSVPMPSTLTPDEMLTRGAAIMDTARQHPDKLASFIHQLELVANGKVIGRAAPLGNWPSEPDAIDTYRTQLIARAAVVADKPETREDCFALKLLSQAAERAGIPLPQHLSTKTIGADAALRMRLMTAKPLLF
jgi:hypothetical protein